MTIFSALRRRVLAVSALAVFHAGLAGTGAARGQEPGPEKARPSGGQAAPATPVPPPLKDLNGDFSFTPPATREAWERRATEVRLRVKVALGLHPEPERTPLRAVIHGRRELEGYTVEKVYFEALPGFFVTGSLYRPQGLSGPLPAVLSPHGHWPDGRFMRATDAEVAREMASGGETDESAARSPLQARCVHLARMGCVVFHYDMTGYADSRQIPQALAHGFRAQRPELSGPEKWGFFSAGAEGRLQSIMGLQTWCSVRALDFLTALPEVDAARVGVTGASGGATQTFILAAVDPRPAVIFPAVMVSTGMQGGCTCENASLLRTGTGNVELAALFAPKPAAYTTADDWTRDFASKGYPQLREIYRVMGAPDGVSLLNRTEFPHNYNQPSRLAMYQWMARHLKTDRPAPEKESAFNLLTRTELSVWEGAERPAPEPFDADAEAGMLRKWSEASGRAVNGHPGALAEALPVLAGITWEQAAAGPFEWKEDQPEQSATGRDPGPFHVGGILTAGPAGHARSIRCRFYYPETWNGAVSVNLAPPSSGARRGGGAGEWRELLERGVAVAVPEWNPSSAENKTPRVPKDRDFLGYTAGYNLPPAARQAGDLLTLLAWISTHERKPREIRVVLQGDGAPELAMALALGPEGLVAQAVVRGPDVHYEALTDVFDSRLVPGLVKYGGLPALRGLAMRKTGGWQQ